MVTWTCFIWAFLIAMHCDEVKLNRKRYKQYEKFLGLYDFSTITYPTKLSDMKIFEKKNSDKKFALNVFTYSKDKMFICHLSQFNKDKSLKTINLN